MKTLSIRQPWAWLILYAGKDIENRRWRSSFRGPFLIHASKGCTKAEWQEAHDFAAEIRPGLMMPPLGALERGGIVGQAEIVACYIKHHSRWFCGPYGFLIANAKPLPFQPAVGALGFFDCELEPKEMPTNLKRARVTPIVSPDISEPTGATNL